MYVTSAAEADPLSSQNRVSGAKLMWVFSCCNKGVVCVCACVGGGAGCSRGWGLMFSLYFSKEKGEVVCNL